jgi:hypothetical protein
VNSDDPTRPRTKIRQGDVFDVSGSLWIVADSFPNDVGTFESVHCAPIFIPDESPMLDLDVHIERAGGFASLGLLQKISKTSLTKIITDATPSEVASLRRNLVTWFSVFSYDSDFVTTLPTIPQTETHLLPGMILGHKKILVCIVDHWGCFNNYPLTYVAPVVADLEESTILDVEVTSDYRDLFGKRFFVRVNDFFQIEKEILEAPLKPDTPIPMLRYGAIRKVTRSLVFKFGQFSLLL